VLALTVTEFVIVAEPTASTKLAAALSIRRDVDVKRTVGAIALPDTGTPFANVAVIAVALSIEAEELSTPLTITETVYALVGKSVPVIAIVVASLTVTAETVGDPAVSCSKSHAVETLLAQAEDDAEVLSLRALDLRISLGLVMQVNEP